MAKSLILMHHTKCHYTFSGKGNTTYLTQTGITGINPPALFIDPGKSMLNKCLTFDFRGHIGLAKHSVSLHFRQVIYKVECSSIARK
jgi:hypothetical protein